MCLSARVLVCECVLIARAGVRSVIHILDIIDRCQCETYKKKMLYKGV